MPRLLDEAAVGRSSVAANSAMNRGRGLMGPNSYARELGFNPVDFLKARHPRPVAGADPVSPPPAWLDLCCGSGRALIEAAERLAISRPGASIPLVGIDLMPDFDPIASGVPHLRLLVGSLASWSPEAHPLGPQRFDLITCVHGLHYVGDKLGLIGRIVGWLAPQGRFVAHLDPDHLCWESGDAAGPQLLRELRAAGLGYDSRRHLLSCEGPRTLTFPHEFMGADDTAGPNYTGQAAVASYYRRAAADR